MEKDENYLKCAAIEEMFSDILEEQKVTVYEAIFIAVTIIVKSCHDRYKTNREEFAKSLVDFINDNII